MRPITQRLLGAKDPGALAVRADLASMSRAASDAADARDHS
jgi:hypothetical protein